MVTKDTIYKTLISSSVRIIHIEHASKIEANLQAVVYNINVVNKDVTTIIAYLEDSEDTTKDYSKAEKNFELASRIVHSCYNNKKVYSIGCVDPSFLKSEPIIEAIINSGTSIHNFSYDITTGFLFTRTKGGLAYPVTKI